MHPIIVLQFNVYFLPVTSSVSSVGNIVLLLFSITTVSFTGE